MLYDILLDCVTLSDSWLRRDTRPGGKAARGLHRIQQDVVHFDQPKFCYTRLMILGTNINPPGRFGAQQAAKMQDFVLISPRLSWRSWMRCVEIHAGDPALQAIPLVRFFLQGR